MNKINILLAEDQTMLLNALATILDLEDNLNVIVRIALYDEKYEDVESDHSNMVARSSRCRNARRQ